ncbi:MAG: BrnT family toxin [Candidatus Latescibacteria bacterium]|nr:BrnT family toxin [Candidatus Latescibacterota bacterium]
MAVIFEWDPQKAQTNLSTHRVSFEEAMTVFYDPLSIAIADPLHSDQEDRFVIIGESLNRRVLVVVHTDRGDRIRLISARVATPQERKRYEKGPTF